MKSTPFDSSRHLAPIPFSEALEAEFLRQYGSLEAVLRRSSAAGVTNRASS